MDCQSHPTSTRAPRFVLQVPLKYRPAPWRGARPEARISAAPACCFEPSSMETETQIEMMLTLHGELGADAAGMVICRGRIARIEPGSDPLPAVAATIAGYQRVHTQGNDLRRI